MVSLTEYSNRNFIESKTQSIFTDDKRDVCPFCNSTDIIIDHQKAEISCAHCGSVLDENLVDHGPEWRAFDHEQRDRRTRVGAPLTYSISDKGLNTVIDWKNKDIHGHNIPERNQAQMYRLRKWNKRMRVSGPGERNLAFALSEMDRLSSTLSIPRSVREDAAFIYRNAAKMDLIKGRSIESVVAVAIYTACRRCNIPRTLDEISELSKIPKKQLGKTYRFLARELKIKLKPISPIDFLPRFCSNLGLSGIIEAKAIEIINKSRENGLIVGKGPTGIAAAALYIASILLNEKKTQKDIAEVAGVTEVTIRNRYKELAEHMDLFN